MYLAKMIGGDCCKKNMIEDSSLLPDGLLIQRPVIDDHQEIPVAAKHKYPLLVLIAAHSLMTGTAASFSAFSAAGIVIFITGGQEYQ
jgi:hypothetical protein